MFGACTSGLELSKKVCQQCAYCYDIIRLWPLVISR